MVVWPMLSHQPPPGGRDDEKDPTKEERLPSTIDEPSESRGSSLTVGRAWPSALSEGARPYIRDRSKRRRSQSKAAAAAAWTSHLLSASTTAPKYTMSVRRFLHALSSPCKPSRTRLPPTPPFIPFIVPAYTILLLSGIPFVRGASASASATSRVIPRFMRSPPRPPRPSRPSSSSSLRRWGPRSR